jgi:bifunctional DNase/RNase
LANLTNRTTERPLTFQLIVELIERYDDPLDVLAIIQVLLRLLVSFLEVHLDDDHLT